MQLNPNKHKTTLKIAPWEGMSPLCDEKIDRIRAEAQATMNVDGKEIFISAELPRERLKELLEEEGIKVLL